ncbi:MAG TPA: squalene/phytoene synthase family protein [Myxococcales bacterium]
MTGAAWAASNFASSAHLSLSDDALKDFDNAAWVAELPRPVRQEWVRRIRAIRLADRLAENQELQPQSRCFDGFAAHGVAALHIVRSTGGGVPEAFAGAGPAVRLAWTRYLAALRAFQRRDLRVRNLADHRTMLDRLSGSLFQLFPFLLQHQVDAIRGFGALDQFFNNLRDLAEDTAHGICYFPEDALARAGLRREDITSGRWRSHPGWRKLMREWHDRYLPELERGAARFDACRDLHPSLARMRSECRARYARTLGLFRAVDFDFQLFAAEYWRTVRSKAAITRAG